MKQDLIDDLYQELLNNTDNDLVNDSLEGLLSDIKEGRDADKQDSIELTIQHDLTHAMDETVNPYQSHFQVLIVETKHEQFAFPLHTIETLQKRDWMHNHISTNPLQVGTIKHHNRDIKIIDFSAWHAKDETALDKQAKSTFFIMVLNERWGLYLDALPDMQTIAPNSVIWRSETSGKPWIKGTVKGAHYSLIDGVKLGQVFDELGQSTNT